MISENLRELIVKIDTLKLDPRNARKHSQKSVGAVIQSLKDFGQQKPIVADEDGVVIAGNSTLRAARQLEWGEIAVTRFTGTEDQKTAYALADNRTAELSEWDSDVLLEQIAGLGDEYDLDIMGFSSADLGDLLNETKLDLDDNQFEIDSAEFMTVKLTPEQAEIVRGAVDKVKELSGVAELSYSRGIELICADYLGG